MKDIFDYCKQITKDNNRDFIISTSVRGGLISLREVVEKVENKDSLLRDEVYNFYGIGIDPESGKINPPSRNQDRGIMICNGRSSTKQQLFEILDIIYLGADKIPYFYTCPNFNFILKKNLPDQSQIVKINTKEFNPNNLGMEFKSHYIYYNVGKIHIDYLIKHGYTEKNDLNINTFLARQKTIMDKLRLRTKEELDRAYNDMINTNTVTTQTFSAG